MQSRAASRKSAAAHDRRTDALFALVESVGEVQGVVQRLLREKDPDAMEKLMDQGKSGLKDGAGQDPGSRRRRR